MARVYELGINAE